MNWTRVRTVAAIELKQLRQARDYWAPMVLLGAMFFVIIPMILLLSINSIGSNEVVSRISATLDMLPSEARAQIEGDGPQATASYALAVYLFAPMAVVVPLTISTAVGAATIVGERERGTGEFLAHSPAGVNEIYIGKLLASITPGYLTTLIGFGCYSLVVNLIAGPAVGRWFFPTREWLILVLWVIPPFLAFTLSLVLRLSARVKSTAAAQQASGLVSLPLIMTAYSLSSGQLLGAHMSGWIVGGVAWVVALISLSTGVHAVVRSRLLGVANEV